ncbi:uncharacterized protein EI90DRAFT_3038509 [Cantharellus anzutake]|uniref:uncharacterized protein n=1 Tax=Cantharellus anzutake TaxID=1750568 RepID=UPI0019072AB1|nr:uncharacterized protein EI90DRAFT_3038509 [Cantharellus anzutake]KAF8339944.1 hypothetical protein EI90DRAFT_3038509 [Cantharellus anzutake]
MRIECLACSMTISSEVKRSARARECLCEAQSMAEPGRAWIAPLPKSRRLLSDLQLILEDPTGQSAADEGNSTQSTASLPMGTPVHAPHMPESQTPTGLPDGSLSTTAFPANYIGAASAVNGPLYAFPMTSSAHDPNLDEELPDLQTQTLFHPVQGSGEGPASIDPTLFDMMLPFSQFNPDPEMASRSQISNPTSLDPFHHAGPSRSTPSRIVGPVPIVAAIETPDRVQDRWMKTNSNEDVVYWLRGLARELGYHLVPL